MNKVSTLAKFYGNRQMSTFNEGTNLAKNIIESDFIPKDVIKLSLKTLNHMCKEKMIIRMLKSQS